MTQHTHNWGRENRVGIIFKEITAKNFPKLLRHQTIDPSSESINQDKFFKMTPRHIILKLLQTKNKEKLEGAQRKKIHDK